MNLRDLLHGVTADPVAKVRVTGVTAHSKQVRRGDLFVAVEGAATDGHAFIDEAIARGAAAIVAQRLPDSFRAGAGPFQQRRACPCVVVPNTREALVMIAQRFYGHPTQKLRMVGVTGTNGKTTTTYLLKAMLEAAGFQSGLLGTITYQIGSRTLPATNTTPGPLELQRYFAQMVGQGLQWCVMEVSSHALAQGRVAGLEFDAAVFTNLGSDHLDYHKTREAYAAQKRKLFDLLRPTGVAVVNLDDEFGRILTQTIPNRPVITYGMERPARVAITQLACSWQGMSLVLETSWGRVPIQTPLVGRHNAWNVAAAATALLALGIPPDAVRAGVAAIGSVPGRLERVPNDADLNILIDYAHTADAMRLALLSLRELTKGRVIVVFGCGGNRDQSKRPVMGKMAGLLADAVILTSDNPRGEDPMRIIRDIQAGFPPQGTPCEVIPDREQAITAALAMARRDDTVLIAGKGHESYQLFDQVTVPFSDRDVVERWLGSRQSLALA